MENYSEQAAAVCEIILQAARMTPDKESWNAWTDENGRTCLYDSFRGVILNELPAALSSVDAETAKKPIDISGFFYAYDSKSVIEIPEPDFDALLKFTAEHSGAAENQSCTPYDLGDTLPFLNPHYMMEMLQLFPGAKWYVSNMPSARLGSCPVLIIHEKGRGLIMPIRDEKKRECLKRKPTRRAEAAIPTAAPAHEAEAEQKPGSVSDGPTGEPVYTPEEFAAKYAPSLSPEEFFKLYAT